MFQVIYLETIGEFLLNILQFVSIIPIQKDISILQIQFSYNEIEQLRVQISLFCKSKLGKMQLNNLEFRYLYSANPI